MKNFDVENFFENSLELLCISDSQGYFQKLNPRWAEVLGYTIEELKSKPFVEFVHPDDREATMLEAQRLANGNEKTLRFENRYLKKNGHYCWLMWNATVIGNHIYAVAREISDIKLHQIFFEEMQKVTKIGSWRLNIETMTPLWSDVTYDIHEVERGTEIDIKNAINFYAPEVRDQITKCVEDCVQKAKSYDVELPFITAKNNRIWVRAIGTPVVDGGKVTEVYGVFQDITERKTKEAQLFNSSKLASLGEMAGGIAHEINNPLAIISALTAKLNIMLKTPQKYEKEIQSTLVTLDETTTRISNIILGLRTFARDSKNDAFEDICVADILKDTLSLCHEKFKSSGVKLILDTENTKYNILCNQIQISQILLNILNNSFDAIKDQNDKKISVAVKLRGDKIEVRVSDNGPGIKQTDQEKIFEPFYTTKPVGSGTGLGLGISHEIAEIHNGDLYLCAKSKDTTFVLSLPIQAPKEIIDVA